MKRNIYRYILSGGVKLTDPVCNYRLIAGNNIKPNYWGKTAIRICVNDIRLEKWSCDPYSTTENKTKIQDLEPIYMIWTGSKWIQYHPNEKTKIYDEIMRKHYIFCEEKIKLQIKNVKEHPKSYWGKSCTLKQGEMFFKVSKELRMYEEYEYEGVIEFSDGSKYPAASKEPIDIKDSLLIESDVEFSRYMLKVKKQSTMI